MLGYSLTETEWDVRKPGYVTESEEAFDFDFEYKRHNRRGATICISTKVTKQRNQGI